MSSLKDDLEVAEIFMPVVVVTAGEVDALHHGEHDTTTGGDVRRASEHGGRYVSRFYPFGTFAGRGFERRELGLQATFFCFQRGEAFRRFGLVDERR